MRIQQKIKVEFLLKWLNLHLYPSKHGDKHQNYFDTMHSGWHTDERRIFCNGGLNVHIGGIAQKWQSGIIQIQAGLFVARLTQDSYGTAD